VFDSCDRVMSRHFRTIFREMGWSTHAVFGCAEVLGGNIIHTAK
jgi:hypothetical protein